MVYVPGIPFGRFNKSIPFRFSPPIMKVISVLDLMTALLKSMIYSNGYYLEMTLDELADST